MKRDQPIDQGSGFTVERSELDFGRWIVRHERQVIALEAFFATHLEYSSKSAIL